MVWCSVVWCVVLWCVVACYVVLCSGMLWGVVLCGVVLCCGVACGVWRVACGVWRGVALFTSLIEQDAVDLACEWHSVWLCAEDSALHESHQGCVHSHRRLHGQ